MHDNESPFDSARRKRRLSLAAYAAINHLSLPLIEGPSDYGMTSVELDAYWRKLRADGWDDWEIRKRLARPSDRQRG